jgi:membrane-bound ClpP family serine protease
MKGALIFLGLIVIVLGIVAGVYKTTQSHLLGLYTTTSSPYSNLAAPLIIGGVILIIIGAVVPRQK